MTNRQKYCLITDNSGHWFLSPFDKKEEAEQILSSIESYWENGDYDGKCPEIFVFAQGDYTMQERFMPEQTKAKYQREMVEELRRANDLKERENNERD